jgi:hypothetical protein
VIFQVWGDGTKLYDSGVINGTQVARSINVDITGKNQLELMVVDDGDGLSYDHADWASARIVCGGSAPPTVTIAAPASTLTYKVGDVINFSGSAKDGSGNVIPPSGLTWQIIIHHCPGGSCHTHPFLTVNGTSGTFTVPDHGDQSFFELLLTATDSGGLTTSSSVSIQPQTVQLTLATSPSGLQVVYGGTTYVAPVNITTIVGSAHTIQAPSPQGANTFQTWSDGGAQQHDILIGATNLTLTANFTGGPPPQPKAISVDFVGSGTAMAATESAGVVAKTNWNAATGNSRSTALNLVDETGTATGATLTWTSDNNWNTPITDSPGNARMMKGYLDTGSGHPITIALSGLASSSTGYDVYVYTDGDNGGATRSGSYAISGAQITTTTVVATDTAGANFNGTFVQANGSAGNYIKFKIQATAFAITATPGATSDGVTRAAVNGIQIVPSAPVQQGTTVVSVDFVGRGTAMAPGESAGVVASANWNSATGNSRAAALNLVDQNGTATTANVTWTSDNTWSLPIADSPGNTRMMAGYLDTGSGNPITIDVSGLPAATNGYDIYVYIDGDNGNAARTGTYAISGSGITTTSIAVTDPANTNFNGSFQQSTGSTGNYVKFTIEATAFRVTATPDQSSDSVKRAAVNGLQIVAR